MLQDIIQLLDRRTDMPPALAMYGGQMFMAWRSPVGRLLISTFAPGSGWSPPEQPEGIRTSRAPALAVFEDRLYMCWLDVRRAGVTDFSLLVASFSFTTNRWSSAAPIPMATSRAAPALACYGNRLWVAYQPVPTGRIAYASMDATHRWTAPAAVTTTDRNAQVPSLAVFGDKLFLATRNGVNRMTRISSYTDANGWKSEPAPVIGTCHTDGRPTLATFGGKLHVFLLSASTPPPSSTFTLNHATFDGVAPSWTPCALLQRADPYAPVGAAVHHDAAGDTLFVAWPGTDPATLTRSIRFARLGPGLATRPHFSSPDEIPDAMQQAGVSVTALNGRLHAAWRMAGARSSQSGTILTSVFEPETGWQPRKVPDAQWSTHVRPAVAAFNNKLYLAWPDPGTDPSTPTSIRFASIDAGGTAEASVLLAGTSTAETPALAVFKGRLFLAWSTSNKVRYQSLDASGTWSSTSTVPGASSAFGPALAVFGTSLYAAWNLSGSANVQWSRSSDPPSGPTGGVRWSAASTVPALLSLSGVSLAAFADRLYFAVVDPFLRGVLRYATYDDAPGGGFRILASGIGNLESETPPALTSYASKAGNTLALVYEAVATRDLSRRLESRLLAGSVTVDCRFMRGYELDTLTHGGVIVAVTGAAGRVDVVTIGSNNHVFYVFRDTESQTDWKRQDTGLVAHQIAAARTADGRVVVFAPQERSVAYVIQTGTGTSASWTAPTLVNTTPLQSRVARVAARTVGGKVYLATGTKPPSRGGVGSLYLGEWTESSTSVGNMVGMGVTISGLDIDIGMVGPPHVSPAAPAVVLFGRPVRAFVAGATAGIPITVNTTPIAGSITSDADGTAIFLAGQIPANLYFLDEGQFVSIATPRTGVRFERLSSSRGQDGFLEVFALGSDGRLYYVRQTGPRPTPSGDIPWSALIPLGDGLGITSSRDADGHTEAFTTANGLHHWVRRDDTNWEVEEVDVQGAGATIEETITYDVEVTIAGPTGLPAPNTRVYLETQGPAILQVNGRGYSVDAGVPAKVTTDARGKLTVAVRTSTLSTELIELESPANGIGRTVISPNSDLEYRFRTLTTKDVLDATDLAGQPLLTGPDRQEMAEVIAKATVNSMRLAPGSAPMSADGSQRSSRSGLRFKARAPAAEAEPAAAETGPAWHADLRDGELSFRQMTREQAQAVVDDMRSSAAPFAARKTGAAGDAQPLDVLWGDLWRAVRAGLATLAQVVANYVVDGVRAAITFVIDGVTYVLEMAIELVQQAFDIVEGVWRRFRVGFEKLFEWLGFVFDWENILRTQDVLAHSLDELLKFLVAATAKIKETVDAGLDHLATQIDDAFRSAERSLGGATLGQANQGGSVELDAEGAHNPVFNGLMANSAAAQSLTIDTSGMSAQLDKVTTALAANETSTTSGVAFTTATTFFERLAQDPGQVIHLLVTEVLEAIRELAAAGLTAIRTAIDALLEALGGLVTALRTLLTDPWQVPFLSPLYAYLTRSTTNPRGLTLSVAGVTALVIAIPGSALYTAIKGAAPFPDAAAVTAFKSEFTAARLGEAIGLGQTSDASDGGSRFAARSEPGSPLLVAVRDVFPVFYSFAYLIYGFLDASLDQFELGVSPPRGQGYAYLGLETAIQLFGLPLSFVDPQTPASFDPTTAAGLDNDIWLYQWGGVLLDAYFFFRSSSTGAARNSGDVGVAADTLYGIVHLLLHLCLSRLEGHAEPLKTLQNVLGDLPEIGKILRFSGFTSPTVFTALLFIDFGGNFGLALINLGRFHSSLTDRSATA